MLPELSCGLEMERIKSMKMKGIHKDKDCCSTVVLGAHLILQFVLFILFLKFFGIPSVEKYLDKETIVIYSEERTNGIEAPAITIIALKKTVYPMGWKTVQENISYEAFAMFNHCQGISFTSIEDCLKNDTIERNKFLKSIILGPIKINSTSLLDESLSSMWSEDMTATFMGRHFTLRPPMTLPPTYDGRLSFHLVTSFNYVIWLHDENFFLPNTNPFGLPSQPWKVTRKSKPKETKPEPGLYHRITLTKQKKLNLDRRPCEEDPSYSFMTCTKEKLSQKIGCRLPWDRWSQQDRKVCEFENEFKQFEQTYRKLYDAEFDEIEETISCKKPCTYNQFKFVDSSPEIMPSLRKRNLVGFKAASRKTQIEEEVLLYPFTSFVAEFGGALGLFLGFSFMTIWEQIRRWLGK